MPAADLNAITGVILAGGLSRRLAGEDKGLILLNGRPMIEYVACLLQPQVKQLIINANRHRQTYGQLGYPVISDQLSGHLGPLSGIATALDAIDTEFLLTTPCDAPLLPADLAARLYDQIQKENAQLCVVHDGVRLQPVFGLFRRSLLPGLKQALASGERTLRRWIGQQTMTQADFSDQTEAFTNINTQEEREAVEKRLLGVQ